MLVEYFPKYSRVPISGLIAEDPMSFLDQKLIDPTTLPAIDRRAFLRAASGAGLAPAIALLSGTAIAQPHKQGNSNQVAGQSTFDESVFDFWTAKVRSPYEEFVNNEQSKGVVTPQPRDSTFLFPTASKGLVPAPTLETSDIDSFPDDGNSDVTVHVERFRASPADEAALANLQSGTLRVDVKQVTPLLGLPEALAWTAMATLASRDKKQKVPSLNNVKFDPGTLWGQFQNIPLTDGLGFWSWNFFMKKREGIWGQLLDILFKTLNTVQPLLPILGLPGIAVSGLTYVDQIVGGIQAQGQSQWLFKGLDIAVCTTKKGFDAAGAKGARKLPLTTGSYVIIPEDAVSQVDKALVVKDGLLVPSDTPSNKIYDVAKTILPNVSYMTVSVSVSKSTAKSADAKKPATS
jgi:hypothetical protein